MVGKIVMGKKLMNANEFIWLLSQSSCLLCTCHFVSYTERENLNTSMHMHLHTHCNWYKQISYTFWVAAGYVRVWQRTCDITLQHVHWLVSMCASMMEHLFTINSVIRGYHIYKGGCIHHAIGKDLYCEWKIVNCSDPFAMAVKRAISSVVSRQRALESCCFVF